MDWLSVAALGIIWGLILVPMPRRGAPKAKTFPELKLEMNVAQDDTQQPGRWVLTPRKGTRFVGTRERARRRARERRRRIVIVLLESIAVTGLIGLFPPLRGMLYVTAVLLVLLLAYVALVAYMVGGGAQTGPRMVGSAPPPLKVLTLREQPLEFPGEPPRVRIASR